MNALRALDGTPPPVRSHRVERPLVENFIELDAWLDGRIRHARSFLDDGETAQSIGWDAQVRHRARIGAFSEVREQIAPMVEAERAEQQETAAGESIEQQYKRTYGDDPIAPWQAEGR